MSHPIPVVGFVLLLVVLLIGTRWEYTGIANTADGVVHLHCGSRFDFGSFAYSGSTWLIETKRRPKSRTFLSRP